MSSTKLSSAEPFVSSERVCEFLGISPSTLERMVKRKLFPAYQPLGPNTVKRFRLSDVEKAIRRAETYR
jgi:excisionase family DNA binding protein